MTGIDGCKAGWVAVTIPGGAGEGTRSAAGGGGLARVRVAQTLEGLLLDWLAGIDMPLGLLSEGWRTADALARRALGRRGASVFAIPPRPVWAEATYAGANRRCRELTGLGLSAQAWGLRARLLEADRYRRSAAHPLYEVHPELSFAGLTGAALAAGKHTPEGLAARRAALAAAGIELPAARDLGRGVGEDDLLDAAAAAWSARRIAAGTARVLTDPAQRADDGTEIAIRY